MTSNRQRALTLVAEPEPGCERVADRMYHDLLSPPEVRQVRDRVRDFATRAVAPIAGRIAGGDERLDGFPRDAFEAMASNGLFRIPFTADVGGDGLTHRATATAVAVEELAYYSNSVAAIYDVHCILAGTALDQGTEEQRHRWLRPVVDGEIVGSFATSEPGASSDLSPEAVQTVASPDGDGWVLTGRKRWITNSVVAGVVVVLARTGDSLTTFIVPTSAPGVTVGTPDRKLGNRGQITADVILDRVRLGPEAVLGRVGGGLRVALRTLTYGRIGIGAAGVGMAQAAFDRTVAHLKSRHAFGGSLASKQHWQFVMADYAADLEAARSLYLKAALRLDAGEHFPEPEAAMAKLRGTDLAARIARDAVQAFGGLGFVQSLGADDTEGPVEAIYRDSKIGEIYEGANEIQRWVLARQIFGRDHTG
ncbi:acyl-CoA dehydrogenase family protein [Rhodococcus aetherivorans]|uniref:acyl-CoA dehydrogenase family protein n=1 Tax=Rhodococcus TaxID=1827 RepID=UPI00045D4A57|nr:acyl-CoA dehydrogenase family protein [Rhodococcus aetherivorans]AKE89208.1 acyl-CoA dehydrogenase [Rhodococcus aetherivorans]KDE14163.1 acyl-CoA dehydrogenase [Rhodococcus aetherivorans]NCL73046.1 Acyl-CoA dehydrogenase, short-chain specific [Rhodococcus sp. YH1]